MKDQAWNIKGRTQTQEGHLKKELNSGKNISVCTYLYLSLRPTQRTVSALTTSQKPSDAMMKRTCVSCTCEDEDKRKHKVMIVEKSRE